jgi:uncharacterized protein YdgA (DUF945 family)
MLSKVQSDVFHQLEFCTLFCLQDYTYKKSFLFVEVQVSGDNLGDFDIHTIKKDVLDTHATKKLDRTSKPLSQKFLTPKPFRSGSVRI